MTSIGSTSRSAPGKGRRLGAAGLDFVGYAVEGHVPAGAIRRLLAERPQAAGLAVPGMPIGSPGMGGGAPETYEVNLFGQQGRRVPARYLGDREL
jgi:hypothetical protein